MNALRHEQPPTILLAEDDPDHAVLTRRALQRARIANELVVVGDGVQALDYLFCRGAWADREGGLPQLILMDLNMPRMDGLEALRHIRADPRTHQVPVVMLTSSDHELDIDRAYEEGINSYVCKPMGFEALAEAIAQVGAYWLVLNATTVGRP